MTTDEFMALAEKYRYAGTHPDKILAAQAALSAAIAEMEAERDALRAEVERLKAQEPLSIQEVEQILSQHNYELHGDRARYIVRMTEQVHGIGTQRDGV